MKIYKYNKRSLKYDNVSVKTYVIILVACLALSFTGVYLVNKPSPILDKPISEEQKLIIIKEFNKFSEDKLIEKLKELNVKFPYIVLAQAKVETGNFTSKIFREGNNLFGMKEAKMRATTAKGTENNHACYENWTQSVYDYALYQCRYLSALSNDEQYFQYLEQNYAEDPSYVNKLRGLITKEQLKIKF